MLSVIHLYEVRSIDPLSDVVFEMLMTGDQGFINLVKAYMETDCSECEKEILECLDPILFEGNIQRKDYSQPPKTFIGKAWRKFQKHTGIGFLRNKIGTTIMNRQKKNMKDPMHSTIARLSPTAKERAEQHRIAAAQNTLPTYSTTGMQWVTTTMPKFNRWHKIGRMIRGSFK